MSSLQQCVKKPMMIEPDGDMRVPVKMYVTEEIKPCDKALNQLKRLASTRGLYGWVAALPDVHYKGRNPSPTGVTIATERALIPHVLDAGINCGMRIVRTPFDIGELDTTVVDTIFNRFKSAIPMRPEQNRNLISQRDLHEILCTGSRWAIKKYQLEESERDYIENGGSMFGDSDVDEDWILRSVPTSALKHGVKGVGVIGAGNHFLELQVIDEVMEPTAAQILGLRKGQLIFMLHSGAGVVGGSVGTYYTSRNRLKGLDDLKKYVRKWQFHLRNSSNGGLRDTPLRLNYFHSWNDFPVIPADTGEGKRILTAMYAACNYGYVNRMAITEAVRRTVRSVLDDNSIELPLLHDVAHVLVQKEVHDGTELFVHRHGGSRAFPASMMQDHPVFRYTGQPFPVPGAMGMSSYICIASEGAKQTFYSANHGAGRIFDKPEARNLFDHETIYNQLRARNVRIYKFGSDNISEQAPGSYKDVSKVIQAMVDFDIARPVVKLNPLAVLKG